MLQAIRHLHLIGTVTMDIIPPEFALRGSYRHLVTASDNSISRPSSPQHPSSQSQQQQAQQSQQQQQSSTDLLDDDDDNQSTITTRTGTGGNERTLPLYHPSFANSILPSTSMSPSWYSASTQKNSFAKWMSPSFYYSRPATSVILPGQQPPPPQDSSMEEAQDGSSGNPSNSTKRSFIPRDIVTRCLEYRIRRYSPKITPQRMRHVLQRFLKNMVLKANEET